MADIFKNTRNLKKGFSLIELIVVLAVIAILFTGLTMLFNPLTQIQKTHNATRQQDLNQVKNALDAYFNDTGCYPQSLSFGSKWSSGTTVYMEKVPQDPDCTASHPTDCYDYQTDGSTCPQWNILYATMHQPVSPAIPRCILSNASKLSGSCLPTSGLYTYNYCTMSGKLDCSYISANPLPTPIITGSGGESGGSTPTPTVPVPTIDCNGQLSACSNGECNVEQAIQCTQCGGSMICYPDLFCSHVQC